MIEIIPLILTLAASAIGALGSLFLKKGSDRLVLKKIFSNYFIIFGLFLYVVASVIFIFALKYGKLSILYPLLAVNYIWIALLSVKYLNERMNSLKWLGILAVIIGIFFITL